MKKPHLKQRIIDAWGVLKDGIMPPPPANGPLCATYRTVRVPKELKFSRVSYVADEFVKNGAYVGAIESIVRKQMPLKFEHVLDTWDRDGRPVIQTTATLDISTMDTDRGRYVEIVTFDAEASYDYG